MEESPGGRRRSVMPEAHPTSPQRQLLLLLIPPLMIRPKPYRFTTLVLQAVLIQGFRTPLRYATTPTKCCKDFKSSFNIRIFGSL